MKRSCSIAPILCLVLMMLGALGCASLGRLAPGSGDRSRVEAAVARVKPALVRIHVVSADYYGGRTLKSESSGSGVIISPDGYVVTNHHVAGNAIGLVCTMANREEIKAELIGTDPMSDIAIIRLLPETPTRFPSAGFGNSDRLKVGDKVLAMGSPLSLSQSVTEGIVSNAQMTMPSMYRNNAFTLDGENVGSIVRWIGHDAAIYPGNSGGPLVDLDGDVIGINEISLGLSGAIPGNLADKVARELIEKGRIDRAFLGMLLQPIFKHQDGREVEGVIISDVIDGSPADKAEIKSGDRLVKLAGEPVNIHFAEELPPLNLFMGSLAIGKPVKAIVMRDGEKMMFEMEPVLREPVLRKQAAFKQWGLTARNLSLWAMLELKLDSKDGVLVTSIRAGGGAGQAKPSINGGDIILAVDDRPVTNTDDLKALTAELTEGKDEPVAVLVKYRRRGEQFMTVVNVGVQDLDDPGREVRKAWLPIGAQVLTTELAGKMGLEGQTGVRVTRLFENGESTDTLGLKIGDVITRIDEEPVLASEPHEVEVFPQMIRQYRIGSEVALGVFRDGQPITLSVKLPGRPRQPREMKRYQNHQFEFGVRDVAYIDRKTRQWEDAPGGVMIESVQEGGWAALSRLSVGDLLLGIDGKPTGSVKQVRAIMEDVEKERPANVIFKVRRGIHNLFVELEPVWENHEDDAGE